MFGFNQLQLIIIFVGLSAISYVIYDFHYKPINRLEAKVESQSVTIRSQDQTIKDLGVRITQLIEENKVSGFEEYFKGLSDANITINNSDLIF